MTERGYKGDGVREEKALRQEGSRGGEESQVGSLQEVRRKGHR